MTPQDPDATGAGISNAANLSQGATSSGSSEAYASAAGEETHFGYERVSASQKTQRVRGVFESVASRYDVMNDLMSLGMHRLWKRFCIEISGVHSGYSVLDLAGGTADLARLFDDRTGPAGRVVLTDINGAMLRVGRDRMLNEGRIVPAVQCNAEALPFPSRSFDCVSIAFGLRNVTHKELALREMRRVLKPGGVALVLEFSRIRAPLAPLYDWYSFNVLPRLGKLVARDEASYRYLAESIRMHPDQNALKTMLETAGFDKVDWFDLAAGAVALHRAYVF